MNAETIKNAPRVGPHEVKPGRYYAITLSGPPWLRPRAPDVGEFFIAKAERTQAGVTVLGLPNNPGWIIAPSECGEIVSLSALSVEGIVMPVPVPTTTTAKHPPSTFVLLVGGRLAIVKGGRECVYDVTEFDTPMPGRAFQLRRGEVAYEVFVSNYRNRHPYSTCSCPGFAAYGHCKHVDVLQAVCTVGGG